MSTTLPLFDAGIQPHFDGDDYQPQRDHARLTNQLEMVRKVMSGHAPMTLTQIQVELSRAGCMAPAASISAQLRNLRKKRYGAHTILREYVGDGLYTYQMIAGQE